MSVDLGDLVEFLRAQVDVPGVDSFTEAADDELWVLRLRNAFWTARLRGGFPNYTEADGVIDPISGTEDLPRELQQLIVLSAALNVVRSAFRNANTLFRTKAGPVEFETQQSAQVLRELLKALEDEFKEALEYAAYGGDSTTIAYFDSVIERSWSLSYGDTWWIR